MGHGNQPEPPKSERTAKREAFFLEFATETRKRYPNLILMLTGGFRTRAGAEYAINQNACDIIGIGRPSAIDAKFPQLLLDESVPDEEAGLPLNKVKSPWLSSLLPIRSLGAGLESVSLFTFLLGLRLCPRAKLMLFSHTIQIRSSGLERNSLRLSLSNDLKLLCVFVLGLGF